MRGYSTYGEDGYVGDEESAVAGNDFEDAESCDDYDGDEELHGAWCNDFVGWE